MSNWFEMLKEEMEERGDSFELKVCTLTDEQLKVEFYDGYGREEGRPFTAWGENWVYFPIMYDGSEWVGSAPRNPCEVSMEHQGG